MPFVVFVKLLKSHQQPEFCGESHTQSMWILRGSAHNISEDHKHSSPLHISSVWVDSHLFLPLQQQDGISHSSRHRNCVSLCSHCSAIWALCGGENSWSGKQLEGGKDRWRKSGTRTQEGRRWQLWSGLAQEAWWRELEQSWLQKQRNRAIPLPCTVAIKTSKMEISSGISCLIATHRPILHF